MGDEGRIRLINRWLPTMNIQYIRTSPFFNKSLCKAKHDTTVACRRGKFEQVYIKSKCGHSILLDTSYCMETICLHGNHNIIQPQILLAVV